MIRGIGVDTVEIQRIAKAMKREGWLERLFSPDERRMLAERKCPAETVAGRFAAKEAVGKAMGRAMSLKDFRHIAIFQDEAGRLRVKLHSSLEQEMGWEDGESALHVSISHDKGRAVAFALWERL